MQPILTATQISKNYGSGHFQLATLDLTIFPGEIIGLVGENGNGKTTLLRILAGDLSRDSGLLFFEGKEVEAMGWETYKSQIAYIPQRIPKWYGFLRDNLLFQASVLGMKGDEAIARVDFLIDELGLRDYSHLKWSEISSGFRLRFQLAKMLIGKPRLLVLDEPLGNLDVNAQERFLGDLRKYVGKPENGIAVIFSSQLLHEIENVSDKIVLLRKGVLKYHGAVDQIGAQREVNSFEIQCTMSIERFREIWPDGNFTAYGKTIKMELDLTTDGMSVLKTLLDEKIVIHYFRDISSSAKKMF
jgi:ABC-2 type transport system ATP-binding protein